MFTIDRRIVAALNSHGIEKIEGPVAAEVCCRVYIAANRQAGSARGEQNGQRRKNAQVPAAQTVIIWHWRLFRCSGRRHRELGEYLVNGIFYGLAKLFLHLVG